MAGPGGLDGDGPSHCDEARESGQRDRGTSVADEVAAGRYEVDPRKVAAAILRQVAPELYRALVEAGDIEE